MSKKCYRCVASHSAMRLSENGASSSARLMPTDLRRRTPRPGDRWHLDEVFLKINGRLHYLWRFVDQDGDVLDILVQSRRDKKAAKKFFHKLSKGLRYVPRTLITDKLRSYSAAKAEVLPGVEHCQDKGQNNRAENSHQPTRLRERVMRRFKSAGHAQRFLPAFGIITSHFRPGRHLCTAGVYRAMMNSRFALWERSHWRPANSLKRIAIDRQVVTVKFTLSDLGIYLFVVRTFSREYATSLTKKLTLLRNRKLATAYLIRCSNGWFQRCPLPSPESDKYS